MPFFVKVLIRIVVAGLLGGLIGIERGRHGRAAGLRTHILVSIGAAMTSLTSLYLSEVLGYTGDVARISAQVISGIGFLGAGTIMVRNSSVITGLTTAAGMWATAAIGVATGYGFHIGAAAATLVCIFSVTVLSHIETRRKNNVLVYIEFTDITKTDEIIETIKLDEKSLVSFDITPPKSGIPNNVGLVCSFCNIEIYGKIKETLKKNEEIVVLSEILKG